jgi:hypothetical protein
MRHYAISGKLVAGSVPVQIARSDLGLNSAFARGFDATAILSI